MFGGGGRENEALGRLTHLTLPFPLQLDVQVTPSMSVGGADDEFPRRDERVPQWGQQETRDLIAIRGELERDAKRKKNLWEVISARMNERGYRRTPDQCKCKWKNLFNRYKGNETSDPDNGRHCPFYEDLHAVFSERANTLQQLPLDSEVGSPQPKKKGKIISRNQSSEELSAGEDDKNESDEERFSRGTNPRKRKAEREKRLRTSVTEKPPRQPSMGNVNNNSGSSLGTTQEILGEFFQQQLRIDMQWRESMEKHAHERRLFEQEWRQSMEKLERERMMIEQAWREREEQRRIREESRAEKRDALLTALLNKLIRENHV